MPRLPAEPLFELAAYTASKPLHLEDCPYCQNSNARQDACLKTDELGRRLGVTRRTVKRWRKLGVPVQNADAAVTSLGYNPINVWGHYWDDPEYAALVDK